MRLLDSEPSFRRFVGISALFHAGIILTAFLLLNFSFPWLRSDPLVLPPTLRVDLIGLPQHRINETEPPPPQEDPISEEKPSTPKSSKSKLEPEEKTIAIKNSTREKSAQKRLQNELKRIRALERIKMMTQKPVYGNQISKGSSLSPDARVALSASYHEVVLERVRSNWFLPKNLLEQNLRAKVRVQIDERGLIRAIRFLNSSGNPQFDQEVKQTLDLSNPFSPPPQELQSALKDDGVVLLFPM